MNNETMGNVPVNVAAKVLKMDSQTVRLLIQQNLVPWGICFKRKKPRMAQIRQVSTIMQRTRGRYKA